MIKQFSNSRGVSPIIGLLLILVILVGILLVVRSEVVFITSTVFNPESREDITRDIEILGIEDDTLIVGVTRNRNDLRFERLEIEGNECFEESPVQLRQGVNRINFNRTLCPVLEVDNLRFQVNGLQKNKIFENPIILSFTPLQAFGGDNVTDIFIDGVWYRVHKFTDTGLSTFSVVNTGSFAIVDVLVVAGGGGGGMATFESGGGGGAGGFIEVNSLPLSIGDFDVIVGEGGIGGTSNAFATNGLNSVFHNIEAVGGGAGSRRNPSSRRGADGGSGGGAYRNAPGSFGQGLEGQGNDGGDWDGSAINGGGGGGAGGPGLLSQGGIGRQSSITGESVFYAGGGAGGRTSQGGVGGGGAGGFVGQPGQPNTGGGGGSGYRYLNDNSRVSGNGGSGIVIVRYPITNPGLKSPPPQLVQFTPTTPSDNQVVTGNSFDVGLNYSDLEAPFYSFVNFDNSLVGWWRFEDNFIDSSGNNNTGISQGGFGFTNGQFGTAASFNGVNSFVSIPNPSNINYSEMTVSMWKFTPNSVNNWRNWMSFHTNSPGAGFVFEIDSSNQFRFFNIGGFSSQASSLQTSVNLNSWQHISVVLSRSLNQSRIYSDGVLQSTSFWSPSLDSNLLEIQFGGATWRSDSGSRFIQTNLDEVMIFNRALSSNEILSLYNSQINQFENNYDNLDSGSYTIQGYAVDSSGNQFNTEQRTIIVS